MTLAALLLIVASSSGIYLDLINDSRDTLVHVDVAPAGTNRWHAVPINVPLRGGGNSVTVRLDRQGCLYDLRFRFNRGPDLLHPDYDACSGRRYRIGTYRRVASRSGAP